MNLIVCLQQLNKSLLGQRDIGRILFQSLLNATPFVIIMSYAI